MNRSLLDHLELYNIDENEPILTSGVVCRLLKIPVWILKELDREKVVSPTRKRGCSRLYSRRELTVLRHVWYYMNEKKVNVNGIKIILELERK